MLEDEEKIRPFEISVPQSKLDWIAERLRGTHWPKILDVVDFRYGPNAVELRAIVEYWLEFYDWRTQEAHINRLPQFIATIAGCHLHFVHLRSVNPKAIPLLLLHGCVALHVNLDRTVALRKETSAATPPL